MKRKLETVTLLGIDCVDLDRLVLAMNICQQEFEFAEVKILTSIDSERKDVVKIEPIKSIEEYSKFVLSELDKYVDTEHVLIVQYDGFILNPEAWSAEFLKYDYIGAPWLVGDWAVKDFDFPAKLLGQFVVGNGGFSLRSKKLLSLCAKLFREDVLQRYHPEDTAICVYYRQLLEKSGVKFAPVVLAKQFSFEEESTENYHWDGQFGFHYGFSRTDISKWLEKNPEYILDKEKNILKEKSNHENRKYSVTEYDLGWKELFRRESDILKDIFGQNVKLIEHVGSTAVLGLAGKPTIDILILVEKIEVIEKKREAMKSAGYDYLGEYVKKGAVLFVREKNDERLCNVHIFQKDDTDATEMLAVRNYLNQNPEIVREYSKLKMDLYEKYPEDYGMYRKFKDECMENLLKEIS